MGGETETQTLVPFQRKGRAADLKSKFGSAERDYTIDIMPAGYDIPTVALELSEEENLIARIMKEVENNYDYIIMDLPPSDANESMLALVNEDGENVNAPGWIGGGGGANVAGDKWYQFGEWSGGEYNFEMSGAAHGEFKFVLAASGQCWDETMEEAVFLIMRWGAQNEGNMYVDNIVFYDEDGKSLPIEKTASEAAPESAEGATVSSDTEAAINEAVDAGIAEAEEKLAEAQSQADEAIAEASSMAAAMQ